MNHTIRNAMLSVAISGLVCIGAVAQNSDQSSQSPSATTQGSASTTTGQHAHHAKEATENGSSQLGAVDRHFIRKAGEGGLAEVELGKLAAEKGQSEEVKKFGQRMVDDHSKANDQLKQLAESKGVTLPTTLDAQDKATKARLEKLSGEQFDRAYMNDMVKDHTKDVSEFQKVSKTAKDPDVKNFASQTLPTLEDHLKEARTIAPKERKQASVEKKGGI
jgi:putative membrane protein